MPQQLGNLFERVVQLASSHFLTEADRQTILIPVLNQSPDYQRIQWEGDAEAFTVRLVKLLSHRDLVVALRALERWVGDASQIDALCAEIEAHAVLAVTDGAALPHNVALPEPTTSPRLRDHIFISYAHSDRALIERLAADLRDHGHGVWIDFEGIRGGDIWRQAIADGIHASAIVLVALSPDAVASEWVKIEVSAALQAKKRLIPLVVRPLAAVEDKQHYQRLGIDHIQYRDFTQGYDDAFAKLLKDLPQAGAGLPAHCRKIAARLLGLPWGLDHYIQEDARLLPINASPYDEGGAHGVRENLLLRLKRGERMIVLGEPGIGKTVALERLAWELASASPPTVPVLIKLLEYKGEPLLEWVRLKLCEHGEIVLKTTEQTADFLRGMAYECALLLDGLNEVPPPYRERVISEITRLGLEFPRHRLIVTSRVQDESWRQLRVGSAITETLLIQPIRPEDSQGYLTAHLGAAESEMLWDGLDKRMRELALTPLLLWLIKEAYLEAREGAGGGKVRIPDNRGALYGKFVERLLRRDDERGLSRKIPERQRLEALETLALHLHHQQSLTLPRDEAAQQVGGEDMLEALLVNGLLMGERAIRFAPHQTVQEHFAARALEERVTQAAGAPGWLKLVRRAGFARSELEYARDPWWWETFIQLAGMTREGNALALALADINPWLAWWCFEEGGKFDKEVRAKIGNRSLALVYSQQVNDRRAAANALARLKTARAKDYLAILSVDTDAGVSRTALQALLDMGEEGGDALLEHFAERITHLSPIDRAAWGRAIHDIDPRPGVGLRPDGLPDIEWVSIPEGSFMYQDGQQVTLPAFRISRYLVTYAQFQAFIDADDGWHEGRWWEGRSMPDGHNAAPGDQAYKYGNHPRERVSWYDAVAFCRWLSAKLGYEVTLPTEQQYERAARWRDGRKYPYTGTFDSAKGNTRETGIGQTSAVGIFPDGGSVEGVQDLSGNVWEWCLNKYLTPEDTSLAGTDVRVLRGGSWGSDQDVARAVYRSDYLPSNRYSSLVGFRLVAAFVPSQKL